MTHRAARAEQRPGVAAQLARDGERRQSLPEDGDEPEVRVVNRVQGALERAAQRLQQPELVETTVPGRRQPQQLAEDPLAGREADEGSGRTREGLGPLVHAEPELVLEPDRPQQAERIGFVHVVGDRPDDTRVEVLEPCERVVRLAARNGHRHRVEREVPRREVGVDAVDERGEVDRLLRAVRDDPPGAVALRQRERRAAEPVREPPRRLPRVTARDVEVEDGLVEEGVAHRAADDPRLLLCKELTDALVVHGHPTTTLCARGARESRPVAIS